MKELIQVGIKALRKPNGEFCEAMPIYMEATPQLKKAKEELISSCPEAVFAYYDKYFEKHPEEIKTLLDYIKTNFNNKHLKSEKQSRLRCPSSRSSL